MKKRKIAKGSLKSKNPLLSVVLASVAITILSFFILLKYTIATKAANNNSLGRWISLGMEGVNVGAIAISPDFVSDKTLFINSSEGIFKSTNAGHTWEKLVNGLHIWHPSSFGGYNSSVAVSPNYAIDKTVFINSTPSDDGSLSGIYRSQDKGESWKLVNIEDIAIERYEDAQISFSPDYSNDHIILIGGFGFLARSVNNGNSWHVINTSSNRGITDFAFSTNYSSDHTIFAAVTVGDDTSNTGGILKSTDRGETWNLLIPFDQPYITPWAVAVSPNFVHDHIIFAGTDAIDGVNNLIKSVDGGLTWQPASRGLPITDIQDIVISSDGVIYAGAGGGGAFISHDLGNRWSPLNDYPNNNICENFYSLAVSPRYSTDKTLFATCNSRDFENVAGVWKHVLSRGPERDFELLSPFNNGVMWTASQGYLNNRNQSKEGCHIGIGPDHCRNQLFGLDMVPDQQNDTDILAPGNGKVTFRGKLPEENCIGVRITLDNGLNMNVCHFASFNVSQGDRVLRGKLLGIRSSPHVHLSLDDRYRIGTLCPGKDRCFLPVPFDGKHTLEAMSLPPDPNGETVTIPYPLCDQRKVSCQFKVGFQQYQGLKGSSSNTAIP